MNSQGITPDTCDASFFYSPCHQLVLKEKAPDRSPYSIYQGLIKLKVHQLDPTPEVFAE